METIKSSSAPDFSSNPWSCKTRTNKSLWNQYKPRQIFTTSPPAGSLDAPKVPRYPPRSLLSPTNFAWRSPWFRRSLNVSLKKVSLLVLRVESLEFRCDDNCVKLNFDQHWVISCNSRKAVYRVTPLDNSILLKLRVWEHYMFCARFARRISILMFATNSEKAEWILFRFNFISIQKLSILCHFFELDVNEIREICHVS